MVDVNHVARANSFYGLYLPEGIYRIVALADLDRDGFYKNSEIVGLITLHLTKDIYPYGVAGGKDIEPGGSVSTSISPPLAIRVRTPATSAAQDSIFFPQGTIRQLDDPIFSPAMARLGMYSPADFMEQAPMMFYALDEHLVHKVPVVFVHGVGGSVTDFAPIIARLDRQHYKPWFFYYPSGAGLNKLAHLFYRIYLSGKLVHLNERTPLVVVAHSMGGLVVRQAINFYQGREKENKLNLFISIATPFGGHPNAVTGIEKAPLVLPSWYNMNPEGRFIRDLYTKPVPTFTEHHLFYAYGNPDTLKLGENSDGVVPISSQLYLLAQRQATRQYGFNRGHVDILADNERIATLLRLISAYKGPFPESHMKYLIKGGFDTQLPDSYTARERYAIRYMGRYISALAHGVIRPASPAEAHLIAVLDGKAEPNLFTEEAWLRFRKDFPDLAAAFP